MFYKSCFVIQAFDPFFQNLVFLIPPPRMVGVKKLNSNFGKKFHFHHLGKVKKFPYIRWSNLGDPLAKVKEPCKENWDDLIDYLILAWKQFAFMARQGDTVKCTSIQTDGHIVSQTDRLTGREFPLNSLVGWCSILNLEWWGISAKLIWLFPQHYR